MKDQKQKDQKLQTHRLKQRATQAERDLRGARNRILTLEKEKEQILDLRSASKRVRQIKPRKVSGLRSGTAVVLCSDWHIEEQVDPRKVQGRNQYTPDIARERVERLGQAAVSLVKTDRRTFEIKDLVLWLGGDLFSGYIHEELQESNYLSPVKAALLAQDLVEALIRYILRELPDLERIIVPCNYGNHGRLTAKIRISTGSDNSLEWAMYHNIRHRLKDESRVEFLIPEGEHVYLQIYDQVYRFTHGDAVKYNGGVGGVTIPLNKAIAGWDTDIKADVTCLGHFHQYLPLPYAVLNGSLIGWSPYAVRIKARYEHAKQAYFVVDSKEGMTRNSPLWVQKRGTSPKVRRF
jgi:hypothetical protein